MPVSAKLVVALFVVAAGCLGADEAPPPQPPQECAEADAAIPCIGCPDCTGANASRTPAPDLPLGRTWTYAVESFYEPAFTEMRVVVAEKDDAGYLFAGASPDDLAPAVVWHRGWHGTRDLGLAGGGFRALDFPLFDGKSWEVLDGLAVVALAADVVGPDGTEEGFVIEGTREDDGGTTTFRAEYAPSAGALARLVFETAGGYFERLEMTGMSESATYAWFERGARAECQGYVDTPPTSLAAATPLEVGEGHDVVLVSAGGVGGRGAVVPPTGTTWTGEGGATETWTTATLPATGGRWTLTCAGGPDQWYFVAAQAVTWVEADVGSGTFPTSG